MSGNRMRRSVAWLSENWDFFWTNARLGVSLFATGAVLLVGGLWIQSQGEPGPAIEEVVLAFGSGLVLLGTFDVVYAARAQQSFRDLIGEAVPGIVSGVVVHSDHRAVIPRDAALELFLKRGKTVRIMTLTADNYLRTGETARGVLERKVLEDDCSLRVLLYLPVHETSDGTHLGQRRMSAQQLVHEQSALMDDYQEMIDLAPDRVSVRFFTSSLHVNFVMIGDRRMFSAPIMHSVRGLDLPCFEIRPMGPECLFDKFRDDFDFVHNSDDSGVALPLATVRRMYQEGGHRIDRIRELFLEHAVVPRGVELDVSTPGDGYQAENT